MTDATVYQMPETRPIPGGAVALADATKRQPFLKEAVRCGQWVDGNGNKTPIDSARLAHWAETFRQMKAAGVSVPLMSDHTFEAEKTRGVVDDLYMGTSPVDGQPCLYARFTAIGEDAITEVARNDVSILADDFTDGTGKKWPDAIQHIALTPIPVVPGQSGPVPVIASRGGKAVRVVRFSRAQETSEMNWTKLAAALSLTGLTDETAEAAILARVGELTKLPDTVKDLETKVTALSRNQPPKPDSDTLDMAAETTVARLSLMVEKGTISKEQADKLSPMICGDKPENRPAVMLSRSASTAAGLPGNKAFGQVILDIFDMNAARKPATGSTTGRQVALSREGGGDDGARKERQALIDSQAKRAGVAANA